MLPQVKIASTTLAYQSGMLQTLPHSWGSLSRVIKGLGGMIKSLQNLEMSFWPLVHSGHHCPHDPFKIRELGSQLSTSRGDLRSLALAPEGPSSSYPTPSEIHTCFIRFTPEVPPQCIKMPKPGLGRDPLLAPDGFCP